MHSIMPWKTLTKLLAIAALAILFSTRLHASDAPNPPPPPPPPHQLTCDDIRPEDFKRMYHNPMRTTYRPSRPGYDADGNGYYEEALNLKFYAIFKMDKAGDIPVYSWYRRFAGFQCVTNIINRLDFFDPRGCYQGSVCSPVSIAVEQSDYVLAEKWISFKEFCEEMTDPVTKQNWLIDMKQGNLYGAYEYKGMNKHIPFVDRYIKKVVMAKDSPPIPESYAVANNGGNMPDTHPGSPQTGASGASPSDRITPTVPDEEKIPYISVEPAPKKTSNADSPPPPVGSNESTRPDDAKSERVEQSPRPAVEPAATRESELPKALPYTDEKGKVVKNQFYSPYSVRDGKPYVNKDSDGHIVYDKSRDRLIIPPGINKSGNTISDKDFTGYLMTIP
jgi:hypothetical protein